MLNKSILMGRLTKDPETRYTQSNTAVCSFTVAVDRAYVKQGEERKTDFISCQAWGKTAEFISEHFGKGSMIAIEGRIQTRSWDDSEGKKRYVTEVVAERVHFTGEKKGGASRGDAYEGSPDEGFYPLESEGELPF
jgi:single-strand DNA-binding protein